jgi:hypothetical protein
VATGAETLINPVTIIKQDADGNVLEEIEAVRAGTVGRLQPSDSFPQSNYCRWRSYRYTGCCLLAAERAYHNIPDSGGGSPSTHFDETRYGYDVMKRRNRTVSPGGTISVDVFDTRGQVLRSYMGTDDTGGTDEDPTGGGADPNNNMVLVAEYEYICRCRFGL